MRITIEQIRYIHKLLPHTIKDNADPKAMIITRFTKDVTKKSTTNLTFAQANELIKSYGGTPIKYDHWAYLDFTNSQHGRIYSVLMQMEWTLYHIEKQKHIADLMRFSEWLKSNKSPVRKKVKEMTPKECSKVISALEMILEKSL
ncbi:hypothetical protein N9609_00495 [bacterium]|nr:hypothetical protein [bacterium]